MPRFRLHEVVVAGPRRAGAFPPVCREVRADDVWLYVLECFVGDAELRGQVAAQIVEDAVGRSHERVENLLPARVLQIESDALLVAIESLKELAVARTEK